MAKKSKCVILLYGEIGYEANSKHVVSWLQEHASDSVEMHINSPGGDVFEAIAIRAAVLAHADISLFVDSLAASAAAVIALCGKPLSVADYSRLMIHSASAGMAGNCKEIKEQLEMLRSIDGDLAGMIAGKMGMEQSEVLETYFDGNDHWLTADDCIRMGLAEKCGDPMKDTSSAGVWNCINGIRITNNTNSRDMELTRLQATNLFKNCGTEDEVIKQADKIAEESEATATEMAEKNGKIAELEAKLAAIEEQERIAREASDEAAISSAVADGKCTEEQAAIYRDLMKSNRESAIKMLASLKAPEGNDVRDFMKGSGGNGGQKKSYFEEEIVRIAGQSR